MTIFATCEEQIKLNELVIAQSISICLAEVYISILFIPNYTDSEEKPPITGALISMTENE